MSRAAGGARELKSKLSAYLRRVRVGETVRITHRVRDYAAALGFEVLPEDSRDAEHERM